MIISEPKTPERVVILKVILLFMCSLVGYRNYISLGEVVFTIPREANVPKCVLESLVFFVWWPMLSKMGYLLLSTCQARYKLLAIIPNCKNLSMLIKQKRGLSFISLYSLGSDTI